MAKKVSTTVYLTYEQLEKLKELHRETKVPIAEYIREGVELVLSKYKDQIPGQMTLL
jgi:predicted DNA-binding protein